MQLSSSCSFLIFRNMISLNSLLMAFLCLVFAVALTSATNAESSVTVSIEGPTEIVEYIGSSFKLTCQISSTDQIGKVFWYRNGMRMNSSFLEDGFSIEKKKTSQGVTLIYAVSKANKTDSGLYSCRTGIHAHASVMVTVKARRATILKPTKTYFEGGETINLTCSIPTSPDIDVQIKWIKNKQILENNSSRKGMTIELEESETKLTSRLFVSNVKGSDSGSYKCVPPEAAESDTIYIKVDSLPSYDEWLSSFREKIATSPKDVLSNTPDPNKLTTSIPRIGEKSYDSNLKNFSDAVLSLLGPYLPATNESEIAISSFMEPLAPLLNTNASSIDLIMEPLLSNLDENDIAGSIPRMIDPLLSVLDDIDSQNSSYMKKFHSIFNENGTIVPYLDQIIKVFQENQYDDDDVFTLQKTPITARPKNRVSVAQIQLNSGSQIIFNGKMNIFLSLVSTVTCLYLNKFLI